MKSPRALLKLIMILCLLLLLRPSHASAVSFARAQFDVPEVDIIVTDPITGQSTTFVWHDVLHSTVEGEMGSDSGEVTFTAPFTGTVYASLSLLYSLDFQVDPSPGSYVAGYFYTVGLHFIDVTHPASVDDAWSTEWSEYGPGASGSWGLEWGFSGELDATAGDELFVRVDTLADLHVATGQPFPEPSTMLLLGSGLIGLWGLRRKFRK